MEAIFKDQFQFLLSFLQIFIDFHKTTFNLVSSIYKQVNRRNKKRPTCFKNRFEA